MCMLEGHTLLDRTRHKLMKLRRSINAGRFVAHTAAPSAFGEEDLFAFGWYCMSRRRMRLCRGAQTRPNLSSLLIGVTRYTRYVNA